MAGASGASGTGGTTGAAGMAGSGGATVVHTADEDCYDTSDSSTNHFACIDRQGIGPRCLNLCSNKDEDCRKGRVCLADVFTCTGTDTSTCPVGTTACLQGHCFTDQTCMQSVDCIPAGSHIINYSKTCLAPNGAPITKDNPGQCAFLPGLCADGPPLQSDTLRAQTCLPQLVSYQVNVNAGFLVSGSVSGSFAAGTQVTKDLGNNQQVTYCAPDPNRDPRLVSRIPLRPIVLAAGPGVDPPVAPECGADVFKNYATGGSFNQTTDPTAPGYYFDRFDLRFAPKLVPADNGGLLPDTKTVIQEAPQMLDWMKNWMPKVDAPNACIYLGGPVIGDPQSGPDPTNNPPDPITRGPRTDTKGNIIPGRPQHVRALFRNTQIAFLLANLDRAPPGASVIHFDVHGGFRQESVIYPATVQISAPARIVLGPVDSNPASNVMVSQPAPFFFVVDQRRLGTGQGGGPTRGQIVRVSPFGFPTTVGFLPTYEDYQRSGGLFPIQ